MMKKKSRLKRITLLGLFYCLFFAACQNTEKKFKKASNEEAKKERKVAFLPSLYLDNVDKLCADLGDKKLESYYPLDIQIIRLTAGQRFSEGRKNDFQEKHKSRGLQIASQAYSYMLKREKAADYIGYGKKSNSYLLKTTGSDKESLIKTFRSLFLPMHHRDSEEKWHFYNIAEKNQFLLAAYDIGLTQASSNKTLPTRPRSFKIGKKTKLKNRSNSFFELKEELFSPLMSIKSNYSMKLPLKLQSQLRIPIPTGWQYPYGFLKKKFIDENVVFSEKLLFLQNEELWSWYLKKYTRMQILSETPEMIHVRTSLDLSLFCETAYPIKKKYRIQSS